MNMFKNMATAVALFMGVSTAAVAQETKVEYEYQPYPHWFVGAQGGAQVTFTNYKIDKLVTPQYAVQFGRWFAPEFGARFHVMGYETKGGFPANLYTQYGVAESPASDYKFKALTGDMDFLFNMSNILCPNRTNHTWNWILLAGFGVNYSWDYDKYEDLISRYAQYYSNPVRGTKNTTFNGRFGTQVEYNISRNFSVNLELQANYKNDLYNLKVNDKMDWQAVALLGVTYKFGHPKTKKVIEVKEPVYATRIDTVWYEDVTYKTVPADMDSKQNIKFAIRKSDPTGAPEIAQIAEFVKNHKDVKVSVTGYADKGTGTPKINMRYSKKRAEAVTKALVDAGVPAEIITTEWKGDTVQPFPANDDNRVAITIATGVGEKQEKVVTKKFKTKEVKYEVTE